MTISQTGYLDTYYVVRSVVIGGPPITFTISLDDGATFRELLELDAIRQKIELAVEHKREVIDEWRKTCSWLPPPVPIRLAVAELPRRSPAVAPDLHTWLARAQGAPRERRSRRRVLRTWEREARPS